MKNFETFKKAKIKCIQDQEWLNFADGSGQLCPFEQNLAWESKWKDECYENLSNKTNCWSL